MGNIREVVTKGGMTRTYIKLNKLGHHDETCGIWEGHLRLDTSDVPCTSMTAWMSRGGTTPSMS